MGELRGTEENLAIFSDHDDRGSTPPPIAVVGNEAGKNNKNGEIQGIKNCEEGIRTQSGPGDGATIERSPSLPSSGIQIKDSTASSASRPEKMKKRRLIWTPELHLKFFKAVCELGLENAVPKAIVNVMNVPGMTRENGELL